MFVRQLTLLLISEIMCGREEELELEFHATPSRRSPRRRTRRGEPAPGDARDGDAQHRGPNWYNYDDSIDSSQGDVGNDEGKREYSGLSSSSALMSSSESDFASSIETDKNKISSRPYRTCTQCPEDMRKGHKNIGIKWVCGAYQRARRTFKSECMMRYRNCEDGTLFVRVKDSRCKNDTYHGRHWFYLYKV